MNQARWDLFDGLPPAEVDALLEESSPLRLKEGEKLFTLGDDAGASFLVVRGTMKLTLPMVIGGRQLDVMVGERGEGHMLGWSGLIPPHRFTVEASAGTETDLLTLDRTVLTAAFSKKPEVGFLVYSNLARIVGQRLQVFQTMWIREMQHVVSTNAL